MYQNHLLNQFQLNRVFFLNLNQVMSNDEDLFVHYTDILLVFGKTVNVKKKKTKCYPNIKNKLNITFCRICHSM